MISKRIGLMALTLCLGVSGCSSVLTSARNSPIEDDRGTRTIGSKIDDSLIETKVSVNIAKANPELDKGSHIVVSSYNGVVLLAGQTPRADLKSLAEQTAGQVQRVKKVHNELQVMQPSSILARNNDAWLTTKIKTQMLTDESVPSSRIKVITENGIVYLLGLVRQQEANAATNVVQGVSGVQKIVKLFEYID
ncbi:MULTISPECIES: BON domain-containing protein [Pseudomonas]|jgi:osmotically-inducible protein OsmY|uniref:BON domain-containing protein n=1 Tax=Pseudomonas soli TaxID=1306993 RepID=A0A2V4IVM9_9PSED|nr:MULTISPECIES: BON domain-containing protein [Pseudomonas]MBI6952411.1 BON domain-containing protein [Pseudomonas sp. CCOS 191]PMZ99742.1 phospholipid-binding protein [Pseudomonas sp. FW305-42]PNA23390.1 phospholipid-binding protein [Pseudomonas sp. MPR-R1B]PNB20107.1 phospholipid-binding protein [Pseudomonas sp. DP16D-E2]PNB41595.1 phospholipid-binding protein [Pseudomonas sp. FW305-17]